MSITSETPVDPQGSSPLRHVFPGDSEMARRMRDMDWRSTGLGDPLNWPTHLRVAVGLCLSSRFPILLWWGKDLNVLYNDAYISFLGNAKHPWALGRPGRECWAEIWDTIGPMLEGVMATGEATWSEDLQLFFARRLPAEEVFVRFTYGPILSPEGRVDGVFTPCTETTAAVVGARRLRMLTRLAAAQAYTEDLRVAARHAMEALATETSDSPFAALYLAEGGSATGTCIAATEPPAGTGLETDPELVAAIGTALAGGDAAPTILTTDRVLVRRSPYPERPDRWMVFPLPSLKPGASAALVLALSSRCPMDGAYHDYLRLLARHIGELLETAMRRQDDRERAEALAQLDRAKSLFFSNVSHELRTPLTLLLGPLDSALTQATGGQRDELLLARRNAQRLHTLVDTLLDFSRLEAGRLTARLAPTDLAAATADVAALFRSAMEAAGLRLVVDCAPLPTPFNVDGDMWEKIVSNLLSNAYKYTLAGEVRLRLRLVPGFVELSVGDTGVGIPKDEQARLFERFHRMNLGRGRVEEGTGIGLALVRELVQLHGGTITAESDGVHGSTFTVRLPERLAAEPASAAPGRQVSWRRSAPGGGEGDARSRAPGEAHQPGTRGHGGEQRADATAGDSASRQSAGEGGPSRARVLVADDNADMRDYLTRLLRPHWDVDAVGDGEAAWEAIRHRPPDVLVSDVMMPRLDGLGLVLRARADPATTQLPILLLSARVGEDARVEGLRTGADDYLVKPFSGEELVARIEKQMMRARLGSVQQQFSSRLAEVLEQAPVGIAVTLGPDHLYEFANEHYRRFVPGRTLIGRSLRANFPDLEGQGIFEIYDRVYESGQPESVSPLQVLLRSPESGELEERHFDIVYQPLVGPDGRVNGIATVASDVHEVVRARARAEEASRAKDDFMAMLGHELRNPLAPIASALALLRQRETPAPRELDVIDRQVQHMVRLVGDLLDVSRITRGTVALDRKLVELAEVVSDAVESVLPAIEQRRHRLELQVPPRGLPVLADPDRLTQVVANLLGNAAKFTPELGRLTLRAARRDEQVVLEIHDNGVGMTRDECEQVFDLFVQGAQRADRPLGGLGLGLSIARNLARLHGGQLECRSEGPGLGSTFTLTLPLAVTAAGLAGTPTVQAVSTDPGERAVAAAPAVPAQAAGSATVTMAATAGAMGTTGEAAPPDAVPPSAGKRVLVVDDSVDGAESMAELLRTHGCEVVVAHDGVDALACLDREAVDLVLLDLGLPRLDGYQVAERVRANPALDQVRLVALSGFGQPSDIERSLHLGFETHLTKPADLRRLFALLD